MKLALHLVALCSPTVAAAQDCTAVPDIGTFGSVTHAYDVSADGRVIVGESELPSGYQRWSFRWDDVAGIQNITMLPFFGGRAVATSSDGSTVVGWGDVSGVGTAYRWTVAGGMRPIGTLGASFYSHAPVAVSDNGRVVAGNATNAVLFDSRAFRWTPAGGMQDLGTLGPGGASRVNDVSGDGTTVVGVVVYGDGRVQGFRWTAATGIQDLGSFGGQVTQAIAVSQDGSVVVGSSTDAAGVSRAFRWTAATGMVDIAPAVGEPMTVVGTSADGDAIAGDLLRGATSSAYRWTLGGGVEDLGTMTGTFTVAHAISADGTTVVGDIYDVGAIRAFRWTESGGAYDLGTFDGASTRAFQVSADGTVVVGQKGNATRVFRAEFSPLGRPACRPWTPNSTGCGGFLRVTGSSEVAANAMSLEASFLPHNAAGFFLVAPALAPPVVPPSSQGSLCLAQPIGRYVGPGQVLNSGPDGSFSLAIDLTAIPTPTGFVAAAPGETWCFQAWHRDANPTSTSNFTDAVAVTLR